jgi:glyoxylase-like metal-dependent hydrolase (beta-lactamase superfamily II)
MVDVVPEEWLFLLEEIKKHDGKLIGLNKFGKWVASLKSLCIRGLIRRENNGTYCITPAGEAVIEESRGRSIIDSIEQFSTTLRKIRASTRQREEVLNQKLKGERNVGKENFRNILMIAKLWNSSTPIFPPTMSEDYKGPEGGGGYVLLWNETCICIDPGLNFLTRLYKRGLQPCDIDAIIVTHDHFDHTRDVEALLSLFYELDKRGLPKNIDFLGSKGVLIKYKALLEKGVNKGYLNVFPLQPGQVIKLPNWKNQVELLVTRAIHDEIHANLPVGLVFELRSLKFSSPFKLGITGDTAWSPELYRYFVGTDLLIAHLGTLEKRKRKLLGRHLGLLGLGLLIKGIRPKLAVVSEFGEEVGDQRYDLCYTIQKVTGCNVIPGELNMEIELPSLKGRFGSTKPFMDLDEFIQEIYKSKGMGRGKNE